MGGYLSVNVSGLIGLFLTLVVRKSELEVVGLVGVGVVGGDVSLRVGGRLSVGAPPDIEGQRLGLRSLA